MRVCSAHVSPRVCYPGLHVIFGPHLSFWWALNRESARPEIISDWRTAVGFISRWLIFCLTDWEPQARGAEPQTMSKSRGERLLCGQWTATGLPPGHAAPRLFEELKAMGGAVRDLHLHLHAPGSATVFALARPVCPRIHWLKFQKSCSRQYASVGSCQRVAKKEKVDG